MPPRREHALDRIRCPQMIPVPAGKSKKASSALRSSVRQATAFSYLAPYLSANTSIAASAAAGRRAVNLANVGLHVDLNQKGNLVQDVGGLQSRTQARPYLAFQL